MNTDGNWIFKLRSIQRACNYRRQQINTFASRLYRELGAGVEKRQAAIPEPGLAALGRWSDTVLRLTILASLTVIP